MRTQEAVCQPLASDWVEVTRGVCAGERDAMMDLYALVQRAVLHWAANLDQDRSDITHEAFVAAVQAIRGNHLADARCLSGYVHSMVRHNVAGRIELRMRNRKARVEIDEATAPKGRYRNEENPEKMATDRERLASAMQLLDGFANRERQILYRFYILEQPPHTIQSELGLSQTQYRLTKSRARARLVKRMRAAEAPIRIKRVV